MASPQQIAVRHCSGVFHCGIITTNCCEVLDLQYVITMLCSQQHSMPQGHSKTVLCILQIHVTGYGDSNAHNDSI